jgi:hypothetical protein
MSKNFFPPPPLFEKKVFLDTRKDKREASCNLVEPAEKNTKARSEKGEKWRENPGSCRDDGRLIAVEKRVIPRGIYYAKSVAQRMGKRKQEG